MCHSEEIDESGHMTLEGCLAAVPLISGLQTHSRYFPRPHCSVLTAADFFSTQRPAPSLWLWVRLAREWCRAALSWSLWSRPGKGLDDDDDDDHTAVNLNDRNNQHCTQGCDCFFIEEKLQFFCLWFICKYRWTVASHNKFVLLTSLCAVQGLNVE